MPEVIRTRKENRTASNQNDEASTICAFIFTSTLAAQGGGSITGKVVDLAGDPVPNAPNSSYERRDKSGLQGDHYGGRRLHSAVTSRDLTLHFEDIQLNTLGDGRAEFVFNGAPHPAPTGPAPRMPDGKPDLSCMWHRQRTVDPGKPELKPWAQAVVKERAENNIKDSPQSRRQPLGELLVIIVEGDQTRQIFLDGRGHPKDPNPTWMGHSIGHWNGDTLVMETTGFNDKSWFDPYVSPHTERTRLTERFHRGS